MNSIRFLVATDCHLGHKQSDSIRGQDSFKAFSQVMSKARQQRVDFLLLGGDLFDEVNPSQKSLYRCLSIMNENIFGDRQIQIKVIEYGSHGGIKDLKPNFENSNINISLPIFTIHGNHDYPSTDFGKLSICDLLHTTNYLNYFGKQSNLNKIIIEPLIIQKFYCKTKLAIYALGYIKDPILHNLFKEGKVQFLKKNYQDCFHLFILHQNRYKKGVKAGASYPLCIPSKYIPEWIDLTIWGHQHQAIKAVQIQDDRKIFQPGSTIATSYIEAESTIKQTILITIEDRACRIDSLELSQSYRPMFYREYELTKIPQLKDGNFSLQKYLEGQILICLQESEKKFPGKKPIIRFKIQYTGFEIIRYKQLEQRFMDRVANKEKMLSFWKRRIESNNVSSDSQLLDALRNKKTISDPNRQIKEDILDYFERDLANRELKIEKNQRIKELISQTTHENSSLVNEHISNYFDKTIKGRCRLLQGNLKQFQANIDHDYKRTTEARLKAIRQGTSNEANQNTLISGEMYKAMHRCKQQEIQNMYKKSPSTKNTGRQQHSCVKSLSNQSKNQRNQMNEGSHAESEDCCQKAQKVKYEQQRNILNFNETLSMINSNKNQNRLGNRKKTSSLTRKGNPNNKTVRFSGDFH